MTKQYQGGPKGNTTFLDRPRRTNHRRWSGIKRHQNCHTKQEIKITYSELIHKGHLRLTKCKLRAKEAVYWPGVNEQLEKLILNCQLCLKYSQSKCKQPPHMSMGQEIPIHPWTKLATDIFHFEGESSPVACGLHKQISHCMQAEFYDSPACHKPLQNHLLRVWMARYS